MDIGILLLYSVLTIVIFYALAVVFTVLQLGQLTFIFSTIFIIPMIIIFYPSDISTPIIVLFFTLYILFLAWGYLRVTYPKNKHQRKIVAYYSEQLAKQLLGYQLVAVEELAYESFPPNKTLVQIYFFVAKKTYHTLIHQSIILKSRWKFIEIAGKSDDIDYPNQLFIVLILDRMNAPSIAILLSGGTREENKAYYASSLSPWVMALSKLYAGAELIIYPFENKWRNEQWRSGKTASRYFITEIVNLPHTQVEVPEFTDNMLSLLADKTTLEKIRTSTPYAHENFHRGVNFHMRDTIQHAIKLSAQSK